MFSIQSIQKRLYPVHCVLLLGVLLSPCALFSVIFCVLAKCGDYRYFIRMPHRSPFIVYRAIRYMDRPNSTSNTEHCTLNTVSVVHLLHILNYMQLYHTRLYLHTTHNIHINIFIYKTHTHCHNFHGSFCMIFTLNELSTVDILHRFCGIQTFYTVLDSSFNILHSTFPFAPHLSTFRSCSWWHKGNRY